MKITDMLISAIIKKGIVYEARNVDVELDVPIGGDLLNMDLKPGGVMHVDKDVRSVNITPLPQKTIKIKLKAEHMVLKIEKD